ncbi:uncharacterized protein LOC107036714 [Diachasma alloeum]|uniref:uncharacterized protein LOC107036714 n=1 Tax=Diachasma alloeum TaxID=454923 RepID=UPI0007384D3A|nr:uncharacterized protein LOC107036714 [Diachasma alloeum]
MILIIFSLIGLYSAGGGCETTGSEQVLHPPPLVYPFGGTIKLLVGIAVPISLGGRILVYGQNLQFQYALPQNATFFTDYFTSLTKRRRRSTSSEYQRKLFYEFLEEEMSRWCGDGISCMMKSICQVSQIPVGDGSLVGEILNVMLTPDYGEPSLFNGVSYLRAAEAGRRGDDCSIIFSGCPENCGFLDRITKLDNFHSD